MNDIAKTVATTLSLAVTDGMSRAVSHTLGPVLLTKDPRDGKTSLENLYYQTGGLRDKPQTLNMSAFNEQQRMKIEWEVHRYGWGYGLRGTTVIFGVAVLLFHLVLVVAFGIYVAVFWLRGGRWTSRAWGVASEFLALAPVSPPHGDNARTVRNIADGEAGTTMLAVPVKVRETEERQAVLVI
ncbi:hypothetical protein CEP54_012037 [Fusarium duplospermum]|uniref:Uncharacterized protein n=1 Tax=Fusarium duplospermum TaxID=1325734 RepID=A0A428PB05_9HYPO|nr:hypothetical protein CEP54_012037 [Fusarium duplospermum]